MNLILDLGNTTAKVALLQGDEVETNTNEVLDFRQYNFLNLEAVRTDFPISDCKGCILASVTNHPPEIEKFVKSFSNGLVLGPETILPFTNQYTTPETLGQDRLANAAALATLYEGSNALSIDLGTCIKFDFVDRTGTYRGGSISPGLAMRYKALNTFTDKLPLIDMQTTDQLIGVDTNSSIKSGVYKGMVAEINGMIEEYEKAHEGLKMVLTGGDASFFENEVKNTIFADAFFTLRGLNAILNANAG